MVNSFIDLLISALFIPIVLFSSLAILIFYSFRKGLVRSFVLKRIERGKKRSVRDRAYSIIIHFRSLVKRVRLTDSTVPLSIVIIFFVIAYMNLFYFAVITSDSMQPLFGRGDIVLMHSFDLAPKIGDIVLYRTDFVGMPVAHRIIEVKGDNIITKGDAAPDPDFWPVKRTDIQAKAAIVGGKPLVIHDIGIYFVMDYKDVTMVAKYGETFALLSNFLKFGRAFALIIFLLAVILYLALTEREIRRVNL